MTEEASNPWNIPDTPEEKNERKKAVAEKKKKKEIEKVIKEGFTPLGKDAEQSEGSLSFTDKLPEPIPESELLTKIKEEFKTLRERAKSVKINLAMFSKAKVGKTQIAMTQARFDGLKISWDNYTYELKGKRMEGVGGSKIIPKSWPVYILDTEFGTDELEPKFSDVSDRIFIKSVYKENETNYECDPVASLLEVDKMLNLLRGVKEGSIVLDSFPDVYEWMNGTLRVKVLKKGAHAEIQPKEYWWRNDKLRGMVMKLIQIKDVHISVTAQRKAVWKSASGPTDETVANWNDKIPYWFNTIAEPKKATLRGELKRWIDISETRFEAQNKSFQKLSTNDFSFAGIAKAVAPALLPIKYDGKFEIEML